MSNDQQRRDELVTEEALAGVAGGDGPGLGGEQAEFTCNACSHTWTGSSTGTPQCPKCGSWNVTKVVIPSA
ncbi:MAG TPA: hypothetical protein PKM88_00830 [bacterium]|nr:hypothetical protein [bacterium]